MHLLLKGAWPIAAALTISCSGESDVCSRASEARRPPLALSRDVESAHDTLVYENAEDYAIIHDTSNLHLSEMSEADHQRISQEHARHELEQAIPGVRFPESGDLKLLKPRWFMQGFGVVVQNRSTHTFSVGANFGSSHDPACRAAVARKRVEPSHSIILQPGELECEVNLAQLVVYDKHGFFAEYRTVTPQETLR
jgi:hypothetical protein